MNGQRLESKKGRDGERQKEEVVKKKLCEFNEHAKVSQLLVGRTEFTHEHV